MRNRYTYMIVLFAVFSFFCLPSLVQAEKPAIHWLSYTEGINKVKIEHKKAFIHFYTGWCTYCKLMDKRTFSNQKIIRYLNENYIAIRINAEDKANQKVVQQYAAYRYPANFFVSEDGSGIGSRPGFIPADMFISILKYIHSDSYKKLSFADYIKNQ